ncbi:hypothetical protein CCACVL1_18730 [Corchorus capsularis]|uniref:Uncharacterized protein n=1 Tax=Corchorus capsularis TaxID=210143 RepID=A0A1R3HK96_COCAP|nr:hypothetical protein CCACVL1_18730 [Corchorus capsularis]
MGRCAVRSTISTVNIGPPA